MKRLTCEMCGSTDLVKQDGVFVCQTCGCKYSIEEARKMMVEGTVEVAGTVKVDNTGLIDSYLQMADNALDADNYSEAENYANKIIEIDPKAWRAWFIKGKASGWQTTGRNNRYPECFVNWINALQYAPEEERAALRENIALEASRISLAVLKMKCGSFESFQTDDNVDSIKNILSLIERQLTELKEKTGIEAYTSAFKTQLARIVNSAAINGSNDADKDFGSEHRYQSKHQWDKFRFAQDRCLGLLEKAYDLSYDDDLSLTICKNYIAITQEVRDSCSYTYSSGMYVKEYSLTSEAIRIRNETIDKWNRKKDFHDPAARRKSFKVVCARCESSIASIEESAAYRQYWNEHTGEKASLEAEKASLNTQINDLVQSKHENPQQARRDSVKASISSMKKELASLGLFKGREKKELQERIDAANAELKQLEACIQDYDSQIDAQLRPINARISMIDAELAASRGRTPISHGTNPAFFSGDTPDLNLSPTGLLRYLAEMLPRPYNLKTGTDEDIVNVDKATFEFVQALSNLSSALNGKKTKSAEYVDDPTRTKNYSITVFENTEATKTNVFCNSKSITSPIEKNIRFKLSDDFSNMDAAAFVSIVSTLVFDLFPSAELGDLQKVLAGYVFGISDSKGFVLDGLAIKAERKEGVTLTLSRE